ncbi:MAG: AAA family ATPase, partial [Gammaproteobacteria bacterium]|nr:AAA family ATPase [Gammaproteobacteria bacterium]
MKKNKKTDQYFESYELTKDPFPVNAYDNILFLTPELTNRIQQIKKLIVETDKLIVVSSASGAGKSSLADYLDSIKEKNWKACLVQADTDMDRETLAYEIIQQASPDKADEKGMSIPQLHKLLELSSKTEQVPVFIIDDAHKLPIETLEFILELSALKYQETCFHFVLFANEAITDKLNSETLIELTSQLVTTIYLPSLSLAQLKEYIDNRLGSSGEINEYPFSDDDIKEIYTISAGLPKGVNILAREKMLAKLAPESKPKTLLTISIASIIVIVLAAGFYLTSSQDPVTEPSQVIAVAPPQPASPPVATT